MFDRPGNRLIELEAGHAVQFEQPARLAAALLEFIDAARLPRPSF